MARRLFLDWLGVTIAGTPTPPGQLILTHAEDRATGPGTVIGLEMRRDFHVSALVNGVLSHVVEMDDFHRASMLRPGTVVMPAALAAGERMGCSGPELLTAIILGYEVAIRMAEAVGPSRDSLAYVTPACGIFGAAAAAGWLMRLNAQQMAWALGNAASQAAGPWGDGEDDSMARHLLTGKAAANGYLAAELASTGLTGPLRILEGEHGFLSAMSANPRPELIFAGFEDDPLPYKIGEVSVRLHASSLHTHAAVDAALSLRRSLSDVEQVQSVQVETYGTAAEACDNSSPDSAQAARSSLQYCVACALAHGRVGVADFAGEALGDLVIRRLSSITSVSRREDLDALYPRECPSEVRVRLESGKELSVFVSSPRGDPQNRLSPRDLEEKFRAMLAQTEFAELADPLIWSVADVEKLDDVGMLLQE